jgi:hypothetical protein
MGVLSIPSLQAWHAVAGHLKQLNIHVCSRLPPRESQAVQVLHELGHLHLARHRAGAPQQRRADEYVAYDTWAQSAAFNSHRKDAVTIGAHPKICIAGSKLTWY